VQIVSECSLAWVCVQARQKDGGCTRRLENCLGLCALSSSLINELIERIHCVWLRWLSCWRVYLSADPELFIGSRLSSWFCLEIFSQFVIERIVTDSLADSRGRFSKSALGAEISRKLYGNTSRAARARAIRDDTAPLSFFFSYLFLRRCLLFRHFSGSEGRSTFLFCCREQRRQLRDICQRRPRVGSRLRERLRDALIIHPTTSAYPEPACVPPAEHLHASVWSRGHARRVSCAQHHTTTTTAAASWRVAATHKTRTRRATTPRRRRPTGVPVAPWHAPEQRRREFRAISGRVSAHQRRGDVVFCGRL